MLWKTKSYWVAFILSIMIGLSIILPFYFQAEQDEDNSVDRIFDTTANVIVSDVRNQINGFTIGLTSLSSGFGVLGIFTNVSKNKFNKLVDGYFADTSLFTVAYNPFVYDSERIIYESFYSLELGISVVIRQQLDNGTFIVSPARDFYVPIGFTNFPTLSYGVDVYALNDRKIAIDASINGETTLLSPTLLVNSTDTYIMPIIAPVKDIDNKSTAVLALIIFVENFFSKIAEHAIIGTELDVALIYENEILYTSKITDINQIKQQDYVKIINHSFIDKTLQIMITGNSNFKHSIVGNDNETFLIINLCLLVLILILMTYMFYSNDINKRKTIEQIKNTSRMTYNRIVSYFSHEIRNPLNTIYSMLHYVEPENNKSKDNKVLDKVTYDIEDDDMYHLNGGHMKILYNAIYRIKHFVDEMLTYQKMSDDKINLSKQNINIIEFCKNILIQQSINCSSEIELQLIACKEILARPTVVTDPIRLSQIILNGLSNAIKFTEKGYIYIRLSHHNYGNNKYLSLELSNSGIGLGNLNVNNLFVPFAQGRNANKYDDDENTMFNYNIKSVNMTDIEKIYITSKTLRYELCFSKNGETEDRSVFAKESGSGMGMPISRMLSIKLGGYLHIYDEFNKSKYMHTTFHSIINVTDKKTDVLIPINEKSYGSQETLNNRTYSNKFDDLTPYDIHNKDINILIVDDTPDNLRMAKMLLSKAEYNVETLSDGIFIDYDRINKYDIILMDIIMAHSSGLDVCIKLINKGYTGIILATTGQVTEEDIELYQKHGFDGVYGKPFQIKQTDSFFKRMLITKKWNILI